MIKYKSSRRVNWSRWIILKTDVYGKNEKKIELVEEIAGVWRLGMMKIRSSRRVNRSR